MNLAEIPLFALADRRLAWIDQRSQLLAQNVANADTPGYRSVDVPPFAASLARAGAGVALARTNGAHVAGTDTQTGVARADRETERAPDGNAVSLDEQLLRVADTDSAHQLTSELTRKYLGMFRIAIGR